MGTDALTGFTAHSRMINNPVKSMTTRLSNWLAAMNLQMSGEDIPYISRPFEAIRRLSMEQDIAIAMPSSFADEILQWFEDHSPAGSHAIGSMFTSTFYYDAFFWKLEIPLAYGTVQLSALDSLTQMPVPVKDQLQRNHPMMWMYMQLWVDSLDYGFGINDLGRGAQLPLMGNQAFAAQLTASAHRELSASVGLLTETRTPNAKALESERMATEMFLKSYLALHGSMTERDAKGFGHNLEELVKACKLAHGRTDLDELLQHMKVFPPIGARYEGVDYENSRLWSGYAVALRTGVTLIRSLTDRDSRDLLQGKH